MQGNPILRRVYDKMSMTSPDDAYTFSYRYNEKGKLVDFAFTGGGFTEPQAEFTESPGNRLSSAAIYLNDGVHLNAFWMYNENDLITTEMYNFDDTWWFSYAYDAEGRLTKETVFNFDGNGSVEFFQTAYTENGAHYTFGAEDNLNLTADLTFNEKGLPVALKGVFWGVDKEFTYTYNDKSLCTKATVTGEPFGMQTYENTFDDKGYLVQTSINGGKTVYEYTYHNTGRVATQTVLYYDGDNNCEDKTVYSYEYDAKNRPTREEIKVFDEKAELYAWSLYEYTYDFGTFGSDSEMMFTLFDSSGAVISKRGTTKSYNGKNYISKEINTSYSASGEVLEKRELKYLYHNMEELYQTNESFYEGEILVHKIERMEDNRNKKTVEYFYSKEDGSLTKKTELVLTHDFDGVVVKSEYKEYDGTENLLSREVSEYENGTLVKTTYYDAEGNVTKVEENAVKP